MSCWCASPGAHFGEPRVFLDLDPPALIVGQVPMEGVELVARHLVEQGFDEGHGLDVPGAVEHQAAPGEAGAIFDAYKRQALGRPAVRRQQLKQTRRAMKQTCARGGDDAHAIAGDVQAVTLRTEIVGRHALEADQRPAMRQSKAGTARFRG
jgi:hypothetical protein